jgi:DNA invertase Pin-like site-specific DNA recombinase
MITSELVLPFHLTRKAVIYIRLSSPHQVLTSQESLRLQYALQQRAQQLGWEAADIEIIDADLGLTGAFAQPRTGFKDLFARVSLGEIGIILSSEVTRLSRNCSDWYPLLDICGYKHCLIADRDGVYDPGSPNGRMLLGLKGQLSEMELHTIRARMTAGLLNKAERGDLALTLPVGLARSADQRVTLEPNREVQDRIRLVFDTFLRLKSANRVLRFFNDQDLRLPKRTRFGDLVWRKPGVSAILQTLKNPAYAGAFVYGRTRTTRHPGSGQTTIQHLPPEQWRICVRDKYPAYVSWPTFEKIQAMIKDNYAEYDRNKTRGVPRPGSALLHGLVYCGECGHKMLVQYKGGTRYLCNHLRQQRGVPRCQFLPGDPIDAAVVAAFFQALSPVELDMYARALASQATVDQQLVQAQRQQIERLRYEAALAQRQFDHVDPENRLVAGELEKRWEVALRTLKEAEDAFAQGQRMASPPVTLPADLKAALSDLGQHLPELWSQPILTPQAKKALLRCLIDKVVVHRLRPDALQVRIVWKGGDTTELLVAVSVGALAALPQAAEMEHIILDRAQAGQSDAEIAGHLSALGHRSPMAPQAVLPSTVRCIRLKYHLFQKRSQSHPRHIPGYLTVTQLAQALGIGVHWIYDRIHNGCIQITRHPDTGLYLFPDQPGTLQQFRDLLNADLKQLRFSTEYQDV